VIIAVSIDARSSAFSEASEKRLDVHMAAFAPVCYPRAWPQPLCTNRPVDKRLLCALVTSAPAHTRNCFLANKGKGCGWWAAYYSRPAFKPQRPSVCL